MLYPLSYRDKCLAPHVSTELTFTVKLANDGQKQRDRPSRGDLFEMNRSLELGCLSLLLCAFSENPTTIYCIIDDLSYG